MNLTIIIPTINTTGDKEQDKKVDYALTQCLRSLGETVPEIPVVIASNGGDPKYIAEYLHLKTTRINVWEQGQCKAVNAAVATTNTEWIMISNDDMIYPPGWLEKLIDNLKHNNIKCISAKLVEPQDGAPTFEKYFCGGAGGDFNRDMFYEYASLSTNSFKVDNGFNLPLLIKRELWDLVGGYDINYDPWGSNSDSDLEYKIKLAGEQPKQSRKCKVYHFSQTSGTFNPANGEYWQRNFKYFEDKWGFPRTDDGIWEADFDIPKDKLKYKPKWAKI
jgi:GT2 family glycosyltransferase